MRFLKTFERGNSSSDRLRSASRRLRFIAGQLKQLVSKIPVARRVAAVEIAFVLALASLSADLLWTILAPSTYASQTAVSMTANGATETYAKRANIALLTTTDLFHREHVSDGTATRVVNAPATQLNLELFGVRFGGANMGDSAIIRTPDNSQDVYRVGDEVMDGVRLARVLQDRIIIRRNGIAESLFLDEEQRVKVAALNQASVTSNSAASEQQFDGEVGTLFSNLTFLPRDTGSGVIIRQRGEGDELVRAGLSNGDILIAINGTPVNDVSALGSLASSLRGVREIEFTLERNGRAETRRIVMENTNDQ